MNNTNNTEELVTINVTDICWDVEHQETLCDLPVDLLNLDMPADMDFENDLADAIADAYGYPITDLSYEVIG
jgi:hypothetical protein